MSSFICSEKDFTRITKLVVKGMNLYRNSRDEFAYSIQKELQEVFEICPAMVNSDRDYLKAINEIYKKIKKMNYDAVFERYKDDYKIEFKNQVGFMPFGRITHQDYKTIQCYLYQCYEGDVPETPLFKVLKKLEKEVACYIVENQPEYEEAQWGEYDE